MTLPLGYIQNKMEKRFKTKKDLVSFVVGEFIKDSLKRKNKLDILNLTATPYIVLHTFFKSYDPKIKDKKTGEYILPNYNR